MSFCIGLGNTAIRINVRCQLPVLWCDRWLHLKQTKSLSFNSLDECNRALSLINDDIIYCTLTVFNVQRNGLWMLHSPCWRPAASVGVRSTAEDRRPGTPSRGLPPVARPATQTPFTLPRLTTNTLHSTNVFKLTTNTLHSTYVFRLKTNTLHSTYVFKLTTNTLHSIYVFKLTTNTLVIKQIVQVLDSDWLEAVVKYSINTHRWPHNNYFFVFIGLYAKACMLACVAWQPFCRLEELYCIAEEWWFVFNKWSHFMLLCVYFPVKSFWVVYSNHFICIVPDNVP